MDSDLVKEALLHIKDRKIADQSNYSEWPLDFLVDYIINVHHHFSRSSLLQIGKYARKVKKIHGNNHPELYDIYQTFTRMHADIINHLDKEEENLFPYIKKLVGSVNGDAAQKNLSSKEAVTAISMMKEEHDEAGEAMEEIKTLSKDFTPPEDACTTYRLFFDKLEAFEDDLHKHVHLENNILFPKTLKLEKKSNYH